MVAGLFFDMYQQITCTRRISFCYKNYDRGEWYIDFRKHCIIMTQRLWHPTTPTPPPPLPGYLRHFQIFDKIVSFPYKFLNVFRIRKANWIFEELSNLYLIVFLTHFMPLISFDTPWKHQKTRGFLMFSGYIKRVKWLISFFAFFTDYCRK